MPKGRGANRRRRTRRQLEQRYRGWLFSKMPEKWAILIASKL